MWYPPSHVSKLKYAKRRLVHHPQNKKRRDCHAAILKDNCSDYWRRQGFSQKSPPFLICHNAVQMRVDPSLESISQLFPNFTHHDWLSNLSQSHPLLQCRQFHSSRASLLENNLPKALFKKSPKCLLERVCCLWISRSFYHIRSKYLSSKWPPNRGSSQPHFTENAKLRNS